MTDNSQTDALQHLRAQVEAQQEEMTRQRATLARLARRRRFPRRLMPLALAALLVALVPLAVLAADPVFTDLSQAADVHQPNIQAIGNAGITTGFEDPNNPNQRLYFPKDNVTREEMASFLARTAGLGSYPPVVNAAKLGGVDAASYTRNSQIGTTEVMANVPGPLPKEASFTTGGGRVILFVSGSAFRATQGDMAMNVLVDGTSRGYVRVNTNTANAHDAFVSRAIVITGLAAGSHTLQLTAVNGVIVNVGTFETTTNQFDYFTATVLELP